MSLNVTSLVEVDIITDPHSVNLILDDQLYLGNLSAAQSLELRVQLGVTHILSACPDYPSTGPKHLTIPVDDTEQEDVLIHMPSACRFIQNSLDEGGKVLVHCVMGVSRSVTFVCAYLKWVLERPRIRPNYGFIKQLETFAACNYEPTPTHPAYLAWKTKQEYDYTHFLKVLDSIPVIPDKLFLSCDFPDDQLNAKSLLANLAIVGAIKHRHIVVPNKCREGLLVTLPQACDFIHRALEAGKDSNETSRVLVHCLVESRVCITICAYLMKSRELSAGEAFSFLEDVLPLFTLTANFSRQLELFDACGYAPTAEHPLVKAWIAEPDGPTQVIASRSDYLDIMTKCKTLSRELLEFLRTRST